MKMLAEQGYGGTIICETPKLDYDAQKMQNEYQKHISR
jgi:endonuclease IV